MKLKEFISAIGRGLLRQACGACIERCHALAGTSCRAEEVTAAFFEEAFQHQGKKS